MKYKVTTTKAVKKTITISRKQLWDNYVEFWRDMAWHDEVAPHTSLMEVKNVLCCPEKDVLNPIALRKLFRDGETVMLLGSAMAAIDTIDKNNTLYELAVTDGQRSHVIIPHEDINY